ncbi:MAG: hypothetical protein ABII18_00180 [bacterium]
MKFTQRTIFVLLSIIFVSIYSLSIQAKTKETFQKYAKEHWQVSIQESLHVYYPKETVVKDISKWIEKRHKAYKNICDYLGVDWKYGIIRIYVFNDYEHGLKYGLKLGFARRASKEVFTKQNQTPGHELAHVISHYIKAGKTIESDLITEGLATFLDQKDRDYHAVARDIVTSRSKKIDLLGSKFYTVEKAYPLGASFVRFLIERYGLDRFKQFYAQDKLSEEESFGLYYNKVGAVLQNEWLQFLKQMNR